MRKEFYLLFILIPALTSCNSDVSKTHWATMVKEVNSDSELKMVILLEGDLVKIGRCRVLAKISDKDEVHKIYDALDDARYFCRSYDTFVPKAEQKAICFVDEDNRGRIIRAEWDRREKKVRFAGGYSENLYRILMEYGIIECEKRPDAVFLSSAPKLAKIKFAPMPEYVGRRGKLKKVVFIEGNQFGETKEWHKLDEVTCPKELDKIKEAFSTAKYCVMHIPETSLTEIAMIFIYEDGRNEILIIDLNREDRIVEFEGGYSEKLYDILTAYGI